MRTGDPKFPCHVQVSDESLTVNFECYDFLSSIDENIASETRG